MTASSLPRSTPSAEGVDPAGVLAFLDAVAAAGVDLHSLMVLRHGRVVAEGWWAPYQPDHIQLLYSLSKSFTSTAIGIAQGEGLLTIDDPVVGFFPERVPADLPPRVAGMKVRHLLAMASGHAQDTWPGALKGATDIVGTFLALPPDEDPGSLFCYNQGCTYTLSAIITAVTGQRLVDYLRPRLFDPLGIEQAYWTQTAEGVDQGFSGLHVTTESVAKLGQLHLQDGRWGDRQLLPEAYARAAHTKHVDNAGLMANPDWQQGYGFQFWRCRHDAYRGDGAFGQFCVIVPAADAIVACTAQVTDMQAELDLIWEHLLPALSPAAPPDSAAEARLAERLSSLSTPVVDAPAPGPGQAVTFRRVGEPAAHTGGLGAVRVEPGERAARLVVVVDGTEHAFDLRPGHWVEGELPLHSPLASVAVSGGWTTAATFEADVVSLRSPHRLRLRGRTGPSSTVTLEWQTTPM